MVAKAEIEKDFILNWDLGWGSRVGKARLPGTALEGSQESAIDQGTQRIATLSSLAAILAISSPGSTFRWVFAGLVLDASSLNTCNTILKALVFEFWMYSMGHAEFSAPTSN